MKDREPNQCRSVSRRLTGWAQDIVKLMEAASVCMGLLAMAQTDHATSELPRGPERSAMFVQKAEEYFKGLNVSWDWTLFLARQWLGVVTNRRTDDPERDPGESCSRTGVEDCREFTQGA